MQLFGFSKTKTMASAEKFVQQGKIQNAISEYQKVLKHDPKDLNVVNTVGDLFMKLGQVDQAVVQFKTVGDAYAADGFLLRAIAIYKKITKADVNSPEHVIRLGELYQQQSLHNDARQQFAAAAELLLKQGKNDDAVRLFAKIVESDPENTAVRLKVGELYLKVGNKPKARDMFFEAAQTLVARGSFDGALTAIEKVQQAAGQDTPANILKARAYRELGRSAEAVTVLKALPDLDSQAEALKLLLSAHIELKDFESADVACERLLHGFSDAAAFKKYVSVLLETGEAQRAVHLCHRNLHKFQTIDAAAVSELLLGLINPNKAHPAELEMLRDLLRQNNVSSHDGELAEMLADCYLQSGEHDRARDIYESLAQLEPDNPIHRQNLRQVLSKMGEDTVLQPLPEDQGKQPLMFEAVEEGSPDIAQSYSKEVEDAIRSALVEADLYASYAQIGKAIDSLKSALDVAPSDVKLNARLAALYAHEEHWTEAARCCALLRDLCAAHSLEDDAQRFARLCAGYERQATATPAAHPAAPTPEFHVPATTTQPEPDTDSAAVLTHEIDLSQEWEQEIGSEPAASIAASAEPTADELVEQANFFVAQGMTTEAHAALAQLRSTHPAHPAIAELQHSIDAPAAHAAAVPEFDLSAPQSHAPETRAVPEFAFAPASDHLAPHSDTDDKDPLADMVFDLEASFDLNAPPPPVLPVAPIPEIPHFAGHVPAPAPTPGPPVLQPFAVAAAPAHESATAVAVADPEGSSMLADLLSEFRDDVETEAATPVQDLDTHYQLGVAFREMGLLDEAIGELQNVCNAVAAGAPFASALQAYTWLAQCFIDKQIPQAAVGWYERALRLPGISNDSRWGLHYDWATAEEACGNRDAALKHLLEVYSGNIDYRDTAERIKELRK